MSQPVPPEALVESLAALGVRLVAGVPCSYFSGPLRLLESGYPGGIRYVPAVNEGSAIAIAAGARLAGEPAAVLAQNSGFGNMINPLTSLVLPYRIPLLVLMSMRGWPAAGPGEQQHFWMGQVTETWLRSLDLPYWTLPAAGPELTSTELTGTELTGTELTGTDLAGLFAAVGQVLADRRSAFVLVPKGAIGDDPHARPGPARRTGPSRSDVVRALLAEVTDQHIVATTGYLSRELFNQEDRPGNFYLQGSMGHAASVALGAALTRPNRRFVILDGDGAMLMHMGALSTVGHFLPENVTHVVFDNAGYESTGAQPTAAAGTDFPAVARACGYRTALPVSSGQDLRPALRAALRAPGPAMVAITGASGSVPGGRASEKLAPDEIADRFSISLAPPPRAAPGGAAPPRAAPGGAATRRAAPAGAAPAGAATGRAAPAGAAPMHAAMVHAAPGRRRTKPDELARVAGHPEAYFGRGAARCLGDILHRLSASRVLVVRGHRSFDSSGAAEVITALERSFRISYFAGARPNPRLADVAAGVAVARELAPDAVLGIGGGSAMDLAKAVAVLAPQTADPLTCLRDASVITRRRGGLVLLPTTCGSGSELTRFATIYVGDRKHSLESDQVRADVSVIDPDLSLTAPVPVAAAAGLDALSQAVESYWAVAGTAASRKLARDAAVLLLPALAAAATTGTFADPAVNAGLALGAALAGAAINMTRTTAAHALSYALTARREIPHGAAVALHMRWLAGHNAAATTADCRHPGGPAVLRGLVEDMQRLCEAAAGDRLPALLERLLALGGYPLRLGDIRLAPAEWGTEWDTAVTSARAANNPRLVTRGDVEDAIYGRNGGDHG